MSFLHIDVHSSFFKTGYDVAVKNWQYDLRLQLDTGAAIEPRKADLLSAIACNGSVSVAARELGIGDKLAWVMAESMNEIFVAR
jgi:molybdenum-dependent DNA-binding transcriptional regulator ModE